jgi:hypothetical protein
MVNIKYTGSRFTRRRLPNGRWIAFRPNETVEIESDRLAKELETQRDFVIAKGNTPKVGAGIKTHVKPPKSRGRPPKSKAKTKIQEKVDKLPKGLKKNKKAKKGKAD